MRRTVLVALCALGPLAAQAPFYTDDTAVTERGKFHFEFFNEFDALHPGQYPNLRQNTANYKINFGLGHGLELDLDFPYLAIYRVIGTPASAGVGDVDMGIKWNFHKESPDSPLPALGASLYIEFPTGDQAHDLGSGLTDYVLNFMAQKSFRGGKTRLTGNAGVAFSGNTSTGVVGISTTRGQVYIGGLSVVHDFSPRWTLGGEIFGGISTEDALGRTQLQTMLGGSYNVRNGVSINFGLIAGRYIASPRIGGQLGFSLDVPDLWRRPAK